VDTRDNAPLIAAGGGLLLFISLFLTWFLDASAWEIFDFSDIVLAAIGLLAVAVGAGIATGNPINPPGGPGAALSVAGLIGFGMTATYLFEGEERGIGLFVALIGVIAIIVGAMGLGRGTAAPATRERPAAAAPPPPPAPPQQPPSGP
jgi:hypothetical protein